MARSANLTAKFEIDSTPLTSPTLLEIGGIEDFTFDSEEEVQTGFFVSAGGAGYSDVTAGRLTISVTGKRIVGDIGQDYIDGLNNSFGSARKSTLTVTFDSGTIYTIPCSIEISSLSGGAAEELESFEVTFHSDGVWATA